MDPLTKTHIGYLETYLSSLSVHNSNWKTSIKTAVSDLPHDGKDFLVQLQEHHPQIIADEELKDDSSDVFPPVRITWNLEEGRHIVTSRDITAGEVLFWEPALLLSPKGAAGPTCLNCLRGLPEDFSSCEGCDAPLCQPHCDGTGHTVRECQAFKSGIIGLKKESQTQQETSETNEENDSESETESDEYKANLLKKIKLLNCLMTPLRTLLLMQESSSASEVIAAMQSNAAQRSVMPIGKFLEMQFLNPLSNCLGLQLPPSVLQHTCGIWDTNAFEMRLENGGVGRGLLPLAGLMNHSCIPNTQHWTYRGGIMVMAAKDMAQGTPLTNNYVNTFLGTIPRQKHLLTTKLFVCRCIRCSDPSELGSNASSLVCQECKQGLLQPPQEDGNIWQCNNCTEYLPYERVCLMVQLAGKMVTMAPKEDLKCKRKMLAKIYHLLGEQHYLAKELHVSVLEDILLQPIQEVNLQDLISALGIVKDLLKYIALIEPGYTKFRGVFLLRQLQVTCELLRRCYHGNVTLDTLMAETDDDKGVLVDNNTEEDIHKHITQELKALSPLVSECSLILQYGDNYVKELQELTHKLQTQLDDAVAMVT